MTLHDQLATDIDVLINADDFGETHTINGTSVVCVVDEDTREGKGAAWQGQWNSCLMVALKASLITRPAVGKVITFDSASYYVRVSTVEDGMLILGLERAQAPAETLTCTVIHYTADNGWSARTESSRESNVPCRYIQGTRLADDIDTGDMRLGEAFVSFGPSSGLLSLAVDDAIIVNSVQYRVVDVKTSRDLGNTLIQYLASVLR